jgi:hypothetical protein
MRAVLKPILTATLLLVALSLSAQRSGRTQDPTLNKGEGLEKTRSDLDKIRNNNQDKKSRIVDVYMFAASFSVLDSVLFVSEVQKVSDVIVNNKWFVKERAAFEEQFTERVRIGDDESLLTSLYFSEKSKKVTKSRARLIKRNNKKNKFALVEVSGFSFSNPPSELAD